MKELVLISIFVLTYNNVKCGSNRTVFARHMFYRDMDRNYSYPESLQDTRRVFGGVFAELETFPAVSVLLDRFWIARCSGSVITPYWVLTAAHCVTAKLAYVKYNTKHPSSSDGDSATILYLYRHPNYKVVQEDEGRGMDVTLLHHDLGLVRTRDKMKLNAPLNAITEMGRYDPLDLDTKDLLVLGFGKTEEPTRTAGEELFAVKLRMVPCDRGAWFHCLCGKASPGQSQRGVCAGDSGGPVVYRSVQIGVTSMGPADCSFQRSLQEAGATSVFTSTYHYVGLIKATIADADNEILVSRGGTEPEADSNTETETKTRSGVKSSKSIPANQGGSHKASHQETRPKTEKPVVIQRSFSSASATALLRAHVPMVGFLIFAMIL